MSVTRLQQIASTINPYWQEFNHRVQSLGDLEYQQLVKEPVHRVLVKNPVGGEITADWTTTAPFPRLAQPGAELFQAGFPATLWSPAPQRLTHIGYSTEGATKEGAKAAAGRATRAILEGSPIVGLQVNQELSGGNSFLEMALDNEHDTNSARVASGDYIYVWMGYQDPFNLVRKTHDLTAPPFNDVSGNPLLSTAVFGGRVGEVRRRITTTGDRIHVIGFGWGTWARTTTVVAQNFTEVEYEEAIRGINDEYAAANSLAGTDVISEGGIFIDGASLGSGTTPRNIGGVMPVYDALLMIANQLQVPPYLFWWTPDGRFYFVPRDILSKISRDKVKEHVDVYLTRNVVDAWFRDTPGQVPSSFYVTTGDDPSTIDLRAWVFDDVSVAQHGNQQIEYAVRDIDWDNINQAEVIAGIRAALESLKQTGDSVSLSYLEDHAQDAVAGLYSALGKWRVKIRGKALDYDTDQAKFKYLRLEGMRAMLNMLVNRLTGYMYLVGTPHARAFGAGYIPMIHLHDSREDIAVERLPDVVSARQLANLAIGKKYPRRLIHHIEGRYFVSSVAHYIGSDGYRTGIGFARSLTKLEREDPWSAIFSTQQQMQHLMMGAANTSGVRNQ